MTRTRLVFFLLLLVILAIVALSLATQRMDAQMLMQLYVAGTIFAVGIVILDFLGIFGDHGAQHSGAHEGGMHIGDTGGHDGTMDADPGGALEHTGHDLDLDVSRGHATHLPHSAAAALATLAYLRLFVYFCLGFGPSGWVALASGYTPWLSLALAVPVGLIAVVLAQALFRLQRSDTDSSLRRDDLLMQRATVTVPLSRFCRAATARD
jgi:hypothetical protein